MSTPAAEPRRVPIGDQCEAVAFVVDYLGQVQRDAEAQHDAATLDDCRFYLPKLRAALTTLLWLAHDREGALALLTTKAPPEPGA